MRAVLLSLLTALLLPAVALAQTTGKIAGRVTDAANGDPLPGVSIVIDGTTQGTTSDVDGYYSIINVRPGTHNLRATFIGYGTVLRENVRVQIDLTTTVDFVLGEETVGLDEVIVVAEQPVIQADVSGTQRNVSVEEIQAGRYQSVANVIAAQVGVQARSAFNDRPSIRGSDMNQSQFIVDGVSQGDPLTNKPYYKVNLDAIEEMKMQTGGFSPEYGNLRSGAINVVLKEGGDTYDGSVTLQYSAPGLRHFGPMAFGFNSPIVQPFVNRQQGAWDGLLYNADGTPKLGEDGEQLKQGAHPGWLNIATDAGKAGKHAVPKTKPEGMSDEAYQAMKERAATELYARWLWRHRSEDTLEELKRLQAQHPDLIKFAEGVDLDDQAFHEYGDLPDYRAAVTFGGPVPFLNAVKFFATYDGEQTEYSYPSSQAAYKDHTFRGKLSTNLGQKTKVNFHGMFSTQSGGEGGQGPGIEGGISNNPYRAVDDPNKAWYPHCAVPGQQNRQIYGTQMTHTASAHTFYEIFLTHSRTDYKMLMENRITAPSGNDFGTNSLLQGLIGTEAEADARAEAGELGWENWRDWARINIGGQWYDESPKGYGHVNWRDETGYFRMESCNLRLNDTYSRKWEAKAAMTSQLNRTNQLRAGAEMARVNLFQLYEAIDPSVNGGSTTESEGAYWQGAIFAQDKLEFKGFIANLGLRLDGIVHGKYPVLNGAEGDADSPYSEWLLAGNTDSLFQKIPLERVTQFRLSPRVGISHPISTVAKIFFNYGHMYQWPDALSFYRVNMVRNAGYRVDRFGNPQARPPRTIQFEVGYEQNLFDRMSLRLTGYYKDVNDELRDTRYAPIGQPNYIVSANRYFEDTRGIESFLEVRRGTIPYFSGWASLNYMIESGGEFGYSEYFQDPTRQPSQVSGQVSEPDVRPLFKGAIDFTLPDDFGPSTENFSLIGGLNINLFYTWQRGSHFTWNPANRPAAFVENNVRWKPYQRWDLRATKSLFKRGKNEALLFVDVTNVFNNRNMTAWNDDLDDNLNNRAWAWTGFGDLGSEFRDQIQDYMYSLGYTPENQQEDGSFVNAETGEKITLRPGDWKEDQIDMPGFSPFTFLEYRDIFFGMKLYF